MKKLDRFLQNQRIKQASPWINPGTIVLDIGCFQGELLEVNSSRIFCGYGIDPLLPTTIERDNFKLIPGFFPQDLPLSIGPIDIITALAVFEHLRAEQQVVFAAKCFELLRGQGRVIMTIPSDSVDKILKVMKTFRIIDGMSTEEHYGFRPTDAIEIFSSSGFELEYSKKFQLGFNYLFVFRKCKQPNFITP